jgi:hypothetical protein
VEEGGGSDLPVFSYMMTGQNIGNALWGLEILHHAMRRCVSFGCIICQDLNAGSMVRMSILYILLHTCWMGEAVEVRAVLRALAQR